jgi:hypothetical protein
MKSIIKRTLGIWPDDRPATDPKGYGAKASPKGNDEYGNYKHKGLVA